MNDPGSTLHTENETWKNQNSEIWKLEIGNEKDGEDETNEYKTPFLSYSTFQKKSRARSKGEVFSL